MTHNQSDQNSSPVDEQLYAYFDNELTPAQRQEFEASLRSSPHLQQRLAALQTLSAGLHKINDESTSDHSQTHAFDPASHNPIKSTPSKPRYPRWMPYAALIAIAGITLLTLKPFQQTPGFSAQSAYTNIARDFTPQIICDTPEKFDEYTTQAFGTTISADFQSPLQLVGWRYMGAVYNPDAPPSKPITRILLAQTNDGTQLLAFFVPKGLPAPELSPTDTLNIHKAKINGVTIYEVSPIDEPTILKVLN
ncbi:MAG: anti-sigma factor [Phycisphaerales bacterium]